MSRPGPARPLARPAGFASRKVPSLCSAHFEAAVGLGGASRRAPLDLPVLIPRVKNALPRGTRAALCERQSPQLPTKAVAARGGCVCVPPADLQRPFPLHGASHGGEAADEERGGFGANKFARNPTALFLPAPSALNRPCFGFEVRARADSPLMRQLFRSAKRGGRLPALVVARGAPRVAAPSGDRYAVGGYSMPRQRDLESAAENMSANCLGLARRLAPPTGSARCASATHL